MPSQHPRQRRNPVKRSLRARAALTTVTALCVLSVAACGGSSEDAEAAGSSSSAAGPETTDISVGVQAFAEVSAFYVAVQEGLFEDEGLTVTPQVAGGGGAGLIPGLVSGEQQF